MKFFWTGIKAIYANMWVGRSIRQRLALVIFMEIAAINTFFHAPSIVKLSKDLGSPALGYLAIFVVIFAWVGFFPAVIFLLDSRKKRTA